MKSIQNAKVGGERANNCLEFGVFLRLCCHDDSFSCEEARHRTECFQNIFTEPMKLLQFRCPFIL
jgi:hypothetical protein